MRINIATLIVKMHERHFNNNRLADKAGVSRATVSNIKCGKTCSQDTLIKIAKALEVPVETLLEKEA